MTTNVIETENLSKFYGKNIGIENINLEVKKGEIFGFIGPNGAGKSTLIRTLLNLIFPSSGSGKILGFDIVKETKKIKFNIGYLPAEVNYYYKMTVNDLLEYSLRFYNSTYKTQIKELASKLDLNLDMKIRDLSLGNKKKVSIIQSILHRPDLLILDEPTSGLDPLIQSYFFDILKDENDKGTTIFFSSHVLSDVQKICSRVAIIQKGHLLKIENIDNLKEKMFKKVKINFSDDNVNFEFNKIGATGITQKKSQISFMYNADINILINVLKDLHINNLIIEEPTLEEIFLHYYKKQENLC